MNDKDNIFVSRNPRNSDNQNNMPFDLDETRPGIRIRRARGELNVGDIVLNRYELLEKLGSGAMGMVFKCRDQVSKVEYALKMVPPQLSHNAEAMEDVLANYQLVHGLKHPNIASVDFLERDEYGAYFLIMEYAPGITLSQWIKQKWRSGRPERNEIAEIVRQTASALDYAHKKRILHRDIKPSNIMVAEHGEVKVLDFGLASKVHTTLTSTTVSPANTSGTPRYLSPEQFKGRNPVPASDQYALGVLAYQMLSGHLPFDADDFDVLRSAVLGEEPDPVDGISNGSNQCLRKVLNKDPKARYSSCAAFADALKKAIAEPAVQGQNGLPQDQEEPGLKQNSAPAAETRQAPPSPESLFQKGLADYRTGHHSIAADSFRKAAEQGHAEAQHKLGDCCSYGLGVGKDIGEAVKWYTKAAEQGLVEAKNKLDELETTLRAQRIAQRNNGADADGSKEKRSERRKTGKRRWRTVFQVIWILAMISLGIWMYYDFLLYPHRGRNLLEDLGLYAAKASRPSPAESYGEQDSAPLDAGGDQNKSEPVKSDAQGQNAVKNDPGNIPADLLQIQAETTLEILQQQKKVYDEANYFRGQTVGTHLDAFAKHLGEGKREYDGGNYYWANQSFREALAEAKWINDNVPLRDEAEALILGVNSTMFTKEAKAKYSKQWEDLETLLTSVNNANKFDSGKRAAYLGIIRKFLAFHKNDDVHKTFAQAIEKVDKGQFADAIKDMDDLKSEFQKGQSEYNRISEEILDRLFLSAKEENDVNEMKRITTEMGRFSPNKAKEFEKTLKKKEDIRQDTLNQWLTVAKEAEGKNWEKVEEYSRYVLNVDPSNPEAKRLASEAEDHYFTIGWQYEQKKDYAKAVEWYQKAAELKNADPEAKRLASEADDHYFTIGWQYEQKKDYVKAVEWYQKAAELKNAEAQYRLGYCYLKGRGGLKKDEKKAVAYYKLAAAQQYAPAQCALGICYEEGIGGLKKDEKTAVEYYRFAADQNCAEAQFKLGDCCRKGIGGLKKDEETAVKWYQKAAAQEYAPAQNNLGSCYLNGRGGLKKDEKKAVELYKKAAEQGLADAQFNLGSCYYNGDGVGNKDESKAVELYIEAAKQGHEGAKAILKKLGIKYN